MSPPPPPPLLDFLAESRKRILSKDYTVIPTVILGNTSCDLDSFVSATLLAYFYSLRLNSQKQSHSYIPLLNLPTVPSTELWRLRPEFGTALRLATRQNPDIDEGEKNEVAKHLLQSLVTIADLQSAQTDHGHSLAMALSPLTTTNNIVNKQPTILVDHNSPSISGLSTHDLLTSRLELIGCIDHHMDESSVAPTARPRIIQQGIGSCTSLVVQHLRQDKLWLDPHDQPPGHRGVLGETARLALTPILVDTSNLRATGDKCSDTDREAVRFLESHLTSKKYDRDGFWDIISESKNNSLDLLTIPEIFERDYKEWSEKPGGQKQSGSGAGNNNSTTATVKDTDQTEEFNIGIPSLVQPLRWLIHKSNSPQSLCDHIYRFCRETDHDLSLLALIARGSGPEGALRKELAVIAFGGVATKALVEFERNMSAELQLEEWREDEEWIRCLDGRFGDAKHGAWRVWWQGNKEKSRKQIAPGLRESVRSVLS